MKPAHSPHELRQLQTVLLAYVEIRGEPMATVRASEIDALPLVVWKGKPLRTIRCTGTTGKGAHDCNVPESLLWALISLSDYRCPYHPRGTEASHDA